MDVIIDKLIKYIKKNNIKYITISESNHRSYTSHTFHYLLAKRLYEEKIIDTFSSERLGIHDSEIINYYLENGLDIDEMVKVLPFGGMGYYRIIKYLSKKPFDKYKIVGLEEDKFCPKTLEALPDNLFLSPYYNNKPREEFWLNNIKKIIKERGNLFINGFHLSKGDLIGKYLKKTYPNETLIIAMAALEIKTQILVIDDNKDFNKSLYTRDYKMLVKNVDNIAPPTKFEKKIKNWKLIKINKENENEKFRAIGCYLAVFKKEYDNNIDINNDITYKLKNYDYIITLKKSVYKEKMIF